MKRFVNIFLFAKHATQRLKDDPHTSIGFENVSAAAAAFN